MNGITLPTTEEQRRQLTEAGWELIFAKPFERWRYEDATGGNLDMDLCPGEELAFANHEGILPIEAASKAITVLGLVEAPPGMVMVPREIAEAAESTMLLAETDLRKSARTYIRRGWSACSQHTAERAEELAKHREQLHAILNPPPSPEVKKE